MWVCVCALQPERTCNSVTPVLHQPSSLGLRRREIPAVFYAQTQHIVRMWGTPRVARATNGLLWGYLWRYCSSLCIYTHGRSVTTLLLMFRYNYSRTFTHTEYRDAHIKLHE